MPPRPVQITLRNPRERVEKGAAAVALLMYLYLAAALRIVGMMLRADMPAW
jgi:hypothetical protein